MEKEFRFPVISKMVLVVPWNKDKMLLECLEGATQTFLQEPGLWRSTWHWAHLLNGRKVRE